MSGREKPKIKNNLPDAIKNIFGNISLPDFILIELTERFVVTVNAQKFTQACPQKVYSSLS